MNYLLGALLWLDPHCSRPGKNARWFHFDQWHIGDPPGHDRSSFFFPHSIALNTYPARETTNRGFREDVHRILFPCSLFFLFFFFRLFCHRTLFLSKAPRFSRQTIHSKFVSGFTFPLCEKRQGNLASCRICSTYSWSNFVS